MTPYMYRKLVLLHEIASSFNYKEKPVDIITFLTDVYYLGNFTCQMNNIYSGWQKIIIKLEKRYPCYFIVSRCPPGTGSSTIIYGCLLPYTLYRISCLKDPWKFFRINTPGKLEVIFFNTAASLSQHKGFNLMNKAMSMSPWFLKKGGASVIRNGNHISIDLPLFKFVLISPYISYDAELENNIVAGVIDATSTPNDYEGHKKMICRAFDKTVRERKSKSDSPPVPLGKMFLIASEYDDLCFLREFASEMGIRNNIFYIDESKETICPDKNINKIVDITEADSVSNNSLEQEPPSKVEEPKRQKVDIIDLQLFPKSPRLMKLTEVMKKYYKERNEHSFKS